jgi:hypothetical protein
MRARRWEGVGVAVVQAACGEDVTGEWVAWAGAEPHLEHVLHVCDAGRVETQRLVECWRVLPSPKEGIDEGGIDGEGGIQDGKEGVQVAAAQATCREA